MPAFLEHLATGDAWAPWSSSFSYLVNDVVKGSDGNIYRCIFANSGIDPTGDSGGNWQLIFVLADLTLNVDSQFAGSLNNAWDYVLNATICGQASVTIQLGAGSYGMPTAPFNHPQGAQITLTGTSAYTPSVTSIQSSSGSAGAWLIVLNMSSVANITTADYIIIRNPSGGTNPTYLAGCHAITNVDAVNTRITISSKHHASSAPSGAVTATCAVLKTSVFGGLAGPMINGNRALGLIDKLVLKGAGLGTGLMVGNSSSAPGKPGGSVSLGKDVGIVGWATGLQVGYGASVISGDGTDALAVSGNTINVSVFMGNLYAPGLIVSGSGSFGLQTNGGQVFSDSSHAILTGSTNEGIYAGMRAVASDVGLSSGKVTGNGGNGVFATVGSRINLTSATVQNNAATGVVAFDASTVRATSATISGNTTAQTSPALNTLGNSNSLIYNTT